MFEIEFLPPEVDAVAWATEHPSFVSHRILIIPENFEERALSGASRLRGGISLATLELMLQDPRFEENRQALEAGRNAISAWLESAGPENATVMLLLEEGDRASAIVRGAVCSVLQSFNSALIGAGSAIGIKVSTMGERKEAVDYYLPGYIAAFTMTNGIIGVTSTTSEFRRRGILKLMAASPLPKSSWILANLALQVALAFLLTLLMLAVGHVIFETKATVNLLSVALIPLGSITFCGMGITLGGS